MGARWRRAHRGSIEDGWRGWVPHRCKVKRWVKNEKKGAPRVWSNGVDGGGHMGLGGRGGKSLCTLTLAALVALG